MSAITLLLAKLKPYTRIEGKPGAMDVMKHWDQALLNAGRIPNPEAPSLGQVGLMMEDADYLKVDAANKKPWQKRECGDEPEKDDKESNKAFERRLKKWEQQNMYKALYNYFMTSC